MTFNPSELRGVHGRWSRGGGSRSKTRDTLSVKVDRVHTHQQAVKQKTARLRESATEHHNVLTVKKKLVGKKSQGALEARFNKTRRAAGTTHTRSGARAHAAGVAEQIGGSAVRRRWLVANH